MTDTTQETKIETPTKRYSTKKIIRNTSIIILAVTAGYIHYKYVSQLFDNDRNFSYLSELEREMSLRTEMGFYYSFYKTVVTERPYVAGITKLMYDRLVEYPKEVNAFNRFNIHPEVILGSIYRYLEPTLNTSAHRQCHMVDRGGGLAPVQSCVGLGEPMLFYLEGVWWFAGLTVAAVLIHATSLSSSVLGGVLAVAQYFANHSECTRVQWSPNERENLAAPLLLLQAWLLTLQLRHPPSASFHIHVSAFLLNCACLLFWQFTQFIFLTQTAIMFVMEQLRIIDIKILYIFLHSHFCGLHMAVLLLQGNDMLKSSLYASFFIVVSIYCLFFSSLKIKIKNKVDLFVECWLVVLRIAIVLCASLYLKKVISDFLEVEEDSHVWEILYSKFTDYKSFHTMIYTCSEVFDFLPFKSVVNMTKTLLIPFTLFVCLSSVKKWTTEAQNKTKERESKTLERDTDTSNDDEDSGIENNSEIKKLKDLDAIDRELRSKKEREETRDGFIIFLKSLHVEPAVFYNLSQLAVYAVMAALVMRLKLLFATQMCVVSAIIMNTDYYVCWLPKRMLKYIPLLWALLAIPVARYLSINVAHEMSHIGEFSDTAQEELLTWARSPAGGAGAYAGSLPVLSAILLSARRPVVAHPHYEHKEARQRAYAVYKAYGRFTGEEMYAELSALRATYLVLEHRYCYGRSSLGCSFQDIWDVERPALRSRPALCRALLAPADPGAAADHLYRVFHNQRYTVFRVHDYSVRYMPRSFDS